MHKLLPSIAEQRSARLSVTAPENILAQGYCLFGGTTKARTLSQAQPGHPRQLQEAHPQVMMAL